MPTEPTSDAETILTVCALRFDGYQWAESRFADLAEWDALAETYVCENSPSHDLVVNFAVFFRMQRTLCKAGHGFFAQVSDYSRAAVQLFLSLENQPTPKAYIATDHQRQWVSFSLERRAAATQHARTLLGNNRP